MNPERPKGYEQLSLEAAARVDALCDGFEMAWKATRSGAAAPRLSSFLDGCDGPERTVLAGELLVLDRACRERYGRAVRPDDSEELGAGAEATTTSTPRPLHRRTDVPAGRPADWPRVPGLELVDVLGSGGMGVVFKARQVALGRDVAVKFLHDAHRADSGRRERFLQEARAVARLRHPHLVQLYEFGEVPAAGGATSQPYLVLEYVSGGSLADLARGSPQRPGEAARLVETVADAIHYAHQQGVIHRDLKPANVLLQGTEVQGEGPAEGVRGARSSPPRLLTAGLCAKVTDFGLAKLLEGSDLTHSGDVLGTPSYMAPEQAAGQSAPVTAAVDVYGLGAILYEALTGRPPFAAATAEATLGQVRQDEPVPPRRLQPTVPRDLETICLKCLRKEAGRRYASAQELADDLRRFRSGEPVRARPVGTGEQVVVWCRRNPGVAGLLAALVLVFLAGSSGVLWQWQHARQERDTARQEKERAEHRLQLIRDRVDKLKKLGSDLLRRPGMHGTGQAVLEESLAFYKDLLPEEGKDPRVRREAAQLYRQVAEIHDHLGQTAQAAEYYGRVADLLTSLVKEDPANKDLRLESADMHRWWGNELRDLGKWREAREAYDQAAELHEALLRESPDEPLYQVALANTLLNIAALLSASDHAEDLERLYRRMLELDRAAVQAAPDNPGFNAELAFGLENQGLFFLALGRNSQAEAEVREALEIHQRLHAGGYLRGSIERYLARNYVNLGRVLAATGRAPEAEKNYQRAAALLEPPVEEFPESALRRAALARTLGNLADLLQDPGRRQEAEEIRRRMIRHYETLKADFPENPQYRRFLAESYLELASLLCRLGQSTEAAELCRKAVELEPEDPAINNNLAWLLATSQEPALRDAALAVRLAKKAVTARPKVANFRNTLGVAHYRDGDDKAAVAELETAMSLRSGGNSFDWFFLAMAHWRLGDRDEARAWFDRAVQWTDKHKPHDDELLRLRAEAEALLAEAGTR
jgi:serine/threonine protein kinase/Tfp pilus assembly protein PilF